ncbi:hypothetical protein [Nocardiopsis suaedae]|uniref:Uncharacterized protein n=1 Tax=Nocardiopsis suaedae TaxID=3018444 RepID=A0ABT4TI62_9ACTN|nr:hypothetical protein [Nocardiopsis suaedae]MDA2804399.1 hypothetical protein [Nocardiopsis suaedae]
MRMSPSSAVLSLVAVFLVLCLAIGLLWWYGGTLTGTDGAADGSAALSPEDFVDAESIVWPPGKPDSASGEPADGLPEGWASTTEAGLDIPVPDAWAGEEGGEEGGGPVLAETDGGELRTGRVQVLTHMTSYRSPAGAVTSVRNRLVTAGRVAGHMEEWEYPAPGIDAAAHAEITFDPDSSEVKDEIGGRVRGFLYAVEPVPEGAPVLIWWGWPEEGYPDDAVDVITVGVRPAV